MTSGSLVLDDRNTFFSCSGSMATETNAAATAQENAAQETASH